MKPAMPPHAPDPESLHRAARGSAINVAGAAVSAVATLALTVAVTRLTSQSDAGVFFSAASLFLLATSLGQLGTNTGLVYFLSGARARGQLANAQAYMRTAARPVLLVAALMSVVMYQVAGPLGDLLSPGREEQFANYMRTMAFFIPCAAVANLALSGTRGLGTMRANAALDQICRPLLQLVLVGFALAAVGPEFVPWAWSAAYLPTAVIGWLWWRRLRDKVATQSVDPTFSPAGPFWRFSSPRALASVTQVAMQRLDIILVGALAGLPEAAIYGAATRFLALGQMAARSVSMSIQPLLGEALARGNRREAKALYQTSTGWLVLVTWPLYLIFMGFGASILQVFGERYTVGERSLFILCGAMLVATACGMVDMVLTMAGRSLWNLTNVLLAFAVNLTLDVLLIPHMGMLGAAVGWAVAILVGNLLPLIQIGAWLKLHPFGRGTVLAMVLCTVAFAGLPMLVRLVWGGGVAPLMISVVLGTVLYVLAVWQARGLLRIGVLLSAVRRRRKGGRERPKMPVTTR